LKLLFARKEKRRGEKRRKEERRKTKKFCVKKASTHIHTHKTFEHGFDTSTMKYRGERINALSDGAEKRLYFCHPCGPNGAPPVRPSCPA
jgi:hypothetical protein